VDLETPYVGVEGLQHLVHKEVWSQSNWVLNMAGELNSYVGDVVSCFGKTISDFLIDVQGQVIEVRSNKNIVSKLLWFK
jgi:hypothetical protein